MDSLIEDPPAVQRQHGETELGVEMKRLMLAVFSFGVLLQFTSSLPAESKNILLICIDDLRPELRCYGVDYIHSPNIDRLAARGRLFESHYVQAPTCGASRFTLLTGRYGGSDNGALFQRATQLRRKPEEIPLSMPGWFRKNGYTTVSVGKVSHHPGGRGGPDWNDDQQPEMPGAWDRHLLPAGPWQHPRGWMHGLANGEIRVRAEEMDVYQSQTGGDEIYPDGISIAESVRQIEQLAGDDKPFFLAVGILRPHLPFGAPANYLQHYKECDLPPIRHPAKPAGQTTWHGSGEFMKYNRWGRNPNQDKEFADAVRRHYAACVSYADAQVGRLVDAIASAGIDQQTTIVVWGDHGWHLGEHAVWGKHTLFEESLRSPLIIADAAVSAPGTPTTAMVETLDVFPTLCELSGIDCPDFVHGRSLVPILKSAAAAGHDAIAYHRNAKTIRSETHRLILHQNGHVELYDHRTSEGEVSNIAVDNEDLVEDLSRRLDRRLVLRNR